MSLPASGSCWQTLVCRLFTLVSASMFIWPSLLWFFSPSFLTEGVIIRLRTQPYQGGSSSDLSLNYICQDLLSKWDHIHRFWEDLSGHHCGPMAKENPILSWWQFLRVSDNHLNRFFHTFNYTFPTAIIVHFFFLSVRSFWHWTNIALWSKNEFHVGTDIFDLSFLCWEDKQDDQVMSI